MSLETLLQIGRTFRQVKGVEGLKSHWFLKTPSESTSGIKYFTVSVDPKDYSFDLRNKTEIEDENFIRHKILYLDYKTSGSDVEKKYITGDIFRSLELKKNGDKKSEICNFQLATANKPDSHARSKTEITKFEGTGIKAFYDSFTTVKTETSFDGVPVEYTNHDELIRILKDHPSCYIHFDFAGLSWYEHDDLLTQINHQILKTFLCPTPNQGGYRINSFLYKTLSKDRDNVPRLSLDNHHKVRHFHDEEDFWDLVYSLDCSKKAAFSNFSLRVYVLPKGENLSSKQLQNFFTKSASLDNTDQEQKEEQIKGSNQRALLSDDPDEMFRSILEGVDDEILSFDFIISKHPQSGPDNDLVSLSGLEKSFLSYLSGRVREKRKTIENMMFREGISKSERGLTISGSFLNIFGDFGREKKRYQSHLMRTLPKIYGGTYFDDPYLLPAFIEKVEANIRNDNPGKTGGKLPAFKLLKFNYYFLVAIRNERTHNERNQKNGMETVTISQAAPAVNNNVKEVPTTPIQDIGYMLGRLARPLSGENSPIKAFEKSYVGRLSSRVATKSHLLSLFIDVNQKLINHNLMGEDERKVASDVIERINAIGNEYDKNECAFGFFEGYYSK